MTEAVAVVGLGNAGLPLVAVITDSGIKVIGVDINEKRCQLINQGTKPLGKVEICINSITFRKGVKEFYHSRNMALARLLVDKGLNAYVHDELLGREEIDKWDLRHISPEGADLVFHPFELKLEGAEEAIHGGLKLGKRAEMKSCAMQSGM